MSIRLITNKILGVTLVLSLLFSGTAFAKELEVPVDTIDADKKEILDGDTPIGEDIILIDDELPEEKIEEDKDGGIEQDEEDKGIEEADKKEIPSENLDEQSSEDITDERKSEDEQKDKDKDKNKDKDKDKDKNKDKDKDKDKDKKKDTDKEKTGDKSGEETKEQKSEDKEKSVGAVYKRTSSDYCYEALSTGKQKKLYKKINSIFEDCYVGNIIPKKMNSDSGSSRKDFYVLARIDRSDYEGLSKDQIMDAYLSAMTDHPMAFFASHSISIDAGSIYILTEDIFGDPGQIQAYRADLEKAVKDISSEAYGKNKEIRKVIGIHDEICKRLKYIFKDDGVTPDDSIYSHSIAGLIYSKKAVCEGYAKLFQAALSYAGMTSFIATGYAGETDDDVEYHAWNIVEIEDEYYAIDITWDDNCTPTGKRYLYFAVGESIYDTHSVSKDEKGNYVFITSVPEPAEENYYKDLTGLELSDNTLTIKEGDKNSNIEANFINDSYKTYKVSGKEGIIKSVDVEKSISPTITIKAAKKSGTAVVNIISKKGQKGKIKVTVQEDDVTTEELTVKPAKENDTYSISKGRSTSLTVKATPNEASTEEKITARSTNKKIATVKLDNRTGKWVIKASDKRTGTCKIIFRAGDVEKTVTVNVKK